MTPEQHRANDMLAAMQMQRDQALNAVVHAQAELAALHRRISELEQDVAGLKEELAAVAKSSSNGTKGIGRQEYSDSDVHPGVAV